MAHTPPTVAQFQERFPEFASADEDLVQVLLTEAERGVDSSWFEADYATAIMFLAAHKLQIGSGAYDTGGLRSFSLGAISVTYADAAKIADPGSTSYGQEYLRLARVNRGGPRVA